MATQAALVQVVQTESARLQQYLTALPADAWTKPSACALWAIRDVVAHLSGIAHGYTDRITRGLRGDTSPSAGFPAPHLFTTLSGEERRQRAMAFAQGPIALRARLGNDLVSMLASLNLLSMAGISALHWSRPRISRLTPSRSCPTTSQRVCIGSFCLVPGYRP
jgi:hypothetical protein